MIIGVDIDDVTANLSDAWIAEYNRKWDDHLTREDMTDWDATQFVKPSCGTKFYDLLTNELYNSVAPVKGALWGVRKLRKMGHRIVFVTSANRRHMGRKLAWLMNHGFLKADDHWSDDYIEAKDKSLFNFDLLIDDAPHNILAAKCPAIVFDQPWNRSLHWTYRAYGWKDVVELVDHIHVKGYLERNNSIMKAGYDTPEALAAGQGVKYDGKKPRVGLIPPYPLLLLAKLFTWGTKKYADRNWEAGMPWEKMFNAGQRHFWKWWLGEDRDQEHGMTHLVSVAWCAITLIEYELTHPEHDNRPKYPADIRARMLAEIEAAFPEPEAEK